MSDIATLPAETSNFLAHVGTDFAPACPQLSAAILELAPKNILPQRWKIKTRKKLREGHRF